MTEVALFHLDRTITDFVLKNGIDDIVSTGLADESLFDTNVLPGMAGERQRFMGWLAGKSTAEIEPLLQVTADRAAERVAGCATVLMEALIENDWELGTFSGLLPQDMLKAYTEGMSKAFPALKFRIAAGAPMQMLNGRYTGERGDSSWPALIRLIESRDRRLGLAADSFITGWPLFNEARQRLYIRPEDRLKHRRDYWDTDHIHWRNRDLDMVDFQAAATGPPRREKNYDLTLPSDKAAFLDATKHLYAPANVRA